MKIDDPKVLDKDSKGANYHIFVVKTFAHNLSLLLWIRCF